MCLIKPMPILLDAKPVETDEEANKRKSDLFKMALMSLTAENMIFSLLPRKVSDDCKENNFGQCEKLIISPQEFDCIFDSDNDSKPSQVTKMSYCDQSNVGGRRRDQKYIRKTTSTELTFNLTQLKLV